jgi:hypothetical protein
MQSHNDNLTHGDIKKDKEEQEKGNNIRYLNGSPFQ